MLFLRRTFILASQLKSYCRKSQRCLLLGQNYNNRLCSTKADYEIDLKLNSVSLNNYINCIKKEYHELCQGTNINSNHRWVELQPIISILNERDKVVENIIGVNELLIEEDNDIRKLAEEEKATFQSKLEEIDQKLLVSLFPNDKEDKFDSIVLEVQAGVGGQEAMLFAKEMFDMYCNFCEYKGWESEIAEYLTTDIGGIRYASAVINGHSAYRYFKHEAGVHRVQRTPATEKAGRVHTSTVSVTALPQPSDIEININPKDLKIETKRSSGAGGQHVNTTDSCVRITHLPTNTSVECQIDRSQIKNRKLAMARLNAMLYQKELEAQMAATTAAKKSQVRSNYRNEKIRTYNFNQDRITDHRLQGCNVHNLKVFFNGGEPLEDLIESLDHQYKLDGLLDVVNSFNK